MKLVIRAKWTEELFFGSFWKGSYSEKAGFFVREISGFEGSEFDKAMESIEEEIRSRCDEASKRGTPTSLVFKVKVEAINIFP